MIKKQNLSEFCRWSMDKDVCELEADTSFHNFYFSEYSSGCINIKGHFMYNHLKIWPKCNVM